MGEKVVALFNANDGLSGRDSGPYLDLEEAREAEVRRARVENRKPDLDNPPASAGRVLLTGKQVVSNLGVNSLPPQANTWGTEDKALRAVADDKDNNLRVYGEVDLSDQVDAADEDGETMQKILAEPDNTEDDSDPFNDESDNSNKAPAKKTAAKKTSSSSSSKK